MSTLEMSATTPVLPEVDQSEMRMEEMPESQDPLVNVPAMKRQALEQRVSTLDTTPDLQVSTTVDLKQITEKLSKLRFAPTASKELSEIFWTVKDTGRVGKRYLDVTITCLLPWEMNGGRTFMYDAVVGMSHEDFIYLAYMLDSFVNYVSMPPRKWKCFDHWKEMIEKKANKIDDKRSLIYIIIDTVKVAIHNNWRSLELPGGIVAAFQRKAVRKISDLPDGMRSNANIALSDSLARFFYALIRIVLM